MCFHRRGFVVSSYYRVLASVSDLSFPWRSIWKPKVPCKVVFFVWIVALGNILTIDNLQKEKFWYWIGSLYLLTDIQLIKQHK